jgi:hypothetical protein
MVKYAKENRIVPKALGLCLCVILSISSGCKKKEQSNETGLEVATEEKNHTSSSEQMAWVGASEKIDLRILYIGLPETDRGKDFVNFLKKHFKRFETIDRKAFHEDKTAEFDVIVLDENIKISREYSRPTVTIGISGSKICDRLALKTGYL